jgi:hypothetical protein
MAMKGGSMQKHLTVLGILFIVVGAFTLIGAGATFLSMAGGTLMSGDKAVISLGLGIGAVVASLLIAMALPALVAGIGLLRGAPWSRLLGFVAAGINLLNIPLGSLLGVYALWVLAQDETVQILKGSSSSNAAMA